MLSHLAVDVTRFGNLSQLWLFFKRLGRLFVGKFTQNFDNYFGSLIFHENMVRLAKMTKQAMISMQGMAGESFYPPASEASREVYPPASEASR